MSRLASILLAISHAKGGAILVDEIENGLHYSVQTDVWKAIASTARTFNTQVFATTHSSEMIDAAHKAFMDETEYDFRYHRLDRSQKTGEIKVVTYDQETLDAAIEMNMERR